MKKKIPFNIEKAKAGAKVETRNGDPVRILCYDKKPDNYPILALINKESGEYPIAYKADGQYFQSGANSQRDLVIVEEVEDVEVDLEACEYDDLIVLHD